MGMLGVAGRVALAKTRISSADVTPNALSLSYFNAGDLRAYCAEGTTPVYINPVGPGSPIQISGINTTITLRVGVTENNDGAQDFQICTSNNTSWNAATQVSQGNTSYTQKTSDITIENNQYLLMRWVVCAYGPSLYSTVSINIKNMSDGEVSLGTFTANVSYYGDE